MIDDEINIINTIKKEKNYQINYQINDKIDTNFQTRKELEKYKFITKELNKLSPIKDKSKINYIYFECFNNRENNSVNAIKKIKKNINKNNIKNIIYTFFKETNTINK